MIRIVLAISFEQLLVSGNFEALLRVITIICFIKNASFIYVLFHIIPYTSKNNAAVSSLIIVILLYKQDFLSNKIESQQRLQFPAIILTVGRFNLFVAQN